MGAHIKVIDGLTDELVTKGLEPGLDAKLDGTRINFDSSKVFAAATNLVLNRSEQTGLLTSSLTTFVEDSQNLG